MFREGQTVEVIGGEYDGIVGVVHCVGESRADVRFTPGQRPVACDTDGCDCAASGAYVPLDRIRLVS